MILLPGGGCLFEMTSSPAGSLINVVVLGVPLCNHSEPKKKGETRCKIQSRPSPPNADSTRLGAVACNLHMLLWFTFLESTEKIHMFISVNARNNDAEARSPR